MLLSHRWTLALVGLIALAGCASAPRAYDPVLATAPSDEAGFARDRDECRTLAQSETWSPNAGNAQNAAVGAAFGVGVLAAATPSVITGGMSVDGAGAAAILAAPVAAYAMSAQRRSEEEQRINERFAACLAERGYEVTDWVLAPE